MWRPADTQQHVLLSRGSRDGCSAWKDALYAPFNGKRCSAQQEGCLRAVWRCIAPLRTACTALHTLPCFHILQQATSVAKQLQQHCRIQAPRNYLDAARVGALGEDRRSMLHSPPNDGVLYALIVGLGNCSQDRILRQHLIGEWNVQMLLKLLHHTRVPWYCPRLLCTKPETWMIGHRMQGRLQRQLDKSPRFTVNSKCPNTLTPCKHSDNLGFINARLMFHLVIETKPSSACFTIFAVQMSPWASC